MITTRIATQKDLDCVVLNPVQETVKDYPYLKLSGYSVAGLSDGVLFGVGGIIINNDVGQVWAIFTKDVNDFPIRAFCAIKREIIKFAQMHSLGKLTSIAREDFTKGNKMLKCLGFTMKSKINDGYYMYEKLL